MSCLRFDDLLCGVVRAMIRRVCRRSILGWNDGHHRSLNCRSNGVGIVPCIDLGDDRFFGKEGQIGRINLIVSAERRFGCFFVSHDA